MQWGKTVTQDFEFTNTFPPPRLTVLFSDVIRPSGCVASDGSVTLSASGGLPPYEYSIDLVNFQNK